MFPITRGLLMDPGRKAERRRVITEAPGGVLASVRSTEKWEVLPQGDDGSRSVGTPGRRRHHGLANKPL